MHLRYVFKFPFIAAVMCAAASVSLGACGGTDPVEDDVVAGAGEAQELTAESAEALTCPASVPLMDFRKSFIVTKERDQAILSQDGFKLQSVLQQIIDSEGSTQDPEELYKRWWDTQNTAANGAFPDAIHCDDNGMVDASNGRLNGFPYACPRPEGALAQADSHPFDPADDDFMEPIALVNRFDLVPVDGAHCGEYRIIYAKKSVGFPDRNFIIFEAQLPNPHPECDVAACLPVAQFWADLSTLDDNTRKEKLKEFYIDGIPGFAPVIKASHFMEGTGQIRTNQFMGFPWLLREFKLDKDNNGPNSSVRLFVKPVTVKDNPFGGLFSTSYTPDNPNDNRDVLFQSSFLGALDGLVPLGDEENDISLRTLPTPDVYNSGDSKVDSSNDYKAQIQGNTAFMTSIETALDPILQNRSLWPNAVTAEDAAARATTQSCAGCHQLSESGPLGGFHVWLGHDSSRTPSSFVHVNEQGEISAQLEWKFLPHRWQVLESFIEEKSCEAACPSTAASAAFSPLSAAVSATSADAPLESDEPVPTLGGSTTH
ncbi:hypothetical protein AB3662_36095 [Sorangium cellulosum]|uniref:hypothetical protein n=1 Tax=Sorangium cellulosum TaxID=56 RepID=UPI003D9AA705